MSLHCICIPKSVIELEDCAFYGCYNLTTIAIKKMEGSVDVEKGVAMLPPGLRHIGMELLLDVSLK